MQVDYKDNPKAFWKREFNDNPIVFSHTWQEHLHLHSCFDNDAHRGTDRIEFLKEHAETLKQGLPVRAGEHTISKSDWSMWI